MSCAASVEPRCLLALSGWSNTLVSDTSHSVLGGRHTHFLLGSMGQRQSTIMLGHTCFWLTFIWDILWDDYGNGARFLWNHDLTKNKTALSLVLGGWIIMDTRLSSWTSLRVVLTTFLSPWMVAFLSDHGTMGFVVSARSMSLALSFRRQTRLTGFLVAF